MRQPQRAVHPRALIHRQTQPAEPAILVMSGPPGGIAIPDAANDLLVAHHADAGTHSDVEIARETPGEIRRRHLCSSVSGLVTLISRALQRIDRSKSEQQRDQQAVNRGMEDISLYEPPVVNDAGDRGDVDQPMEPVPVSSTETTNPSCR